MASTPPDDPETLLTRQAVAEALTAAGYPTSPKTLATKASRGGGPAFQKWSNRPLYAWGSALAWAQSRLGPVVSSTSELGDKDRRRPRLDVEDESPPSSAPGRCLRRRGQL
jgi:hypothetical protein